MDLPTLNSTIAVAGQLGSDSVIFWSAYKSWLLEQGYTIYDCFGTLSIQIEISSVNFYQAVHPYAVFAPDSPPDGGKFYRHQPYTNFARDKLGREVVIKVASNKGQEVMINRLLMGFPELYNPEGFPYVLPPLRILPSPHDFSFVITPRWGHPPMRPFSVNWEMSGGHRDLPLYPVKTVGQVLHWVLSLLKGLAFLHSHRIVHRDLHDGNMLVNCFSFDFSRCLQDFQNHLDGNYGLPVLYALFDFNLSVAFPEDMPIEQCRLDARSIDQGTRYHDPPEVMQGELDYDPFAYDVECMGYILMRFLYPLVPEVPLLAPLLDRMTTYDLSSRFTSEEALQFCESIKGSLSTIQLSAPPPLTNDMFYCPVPEIPWEKLDPQFVVAWSSYRTPPLRIPTRVLRYIASFHVGKLLIGVVRKCFGPGMTMGHYFGRRTFL